MTIEQSEQLIKGDILYVGRLYESSDWLEQAAGSFEKNRKEEGTKVEFMHHHHHLPEFLFCKADDDIAIYHHHELIKNK